MNLEKSEKFGYAVEPFSEDFTGRLSWRELGNKILAAAGMHADNRGFGMKQLLPRGRAWVLSRMTIEMPQMPMVGDRYAVETWIRSIYRTFTDRCFAILRPDGSAYGYAYTTWALIDTATRLPVNLESLPDGGFADWADGQKPCEVAPFSRIRVKTPEPERVITAYYGDIDINRHVNSIRYIEHVLDLFPAKVYQSHSVFGIEIAYHGEAHYGDSLALYRQEAGGGAYNVEVRVLPSEDDGAAERRVCSCQVRFK